MLEKITRWDDKYIILNFIYDHQEQICIVDKKTKDSLKHYTIHRKKN